MTAEPLLPDLADADPDDPMSATIDTLEDALVAVRERHPDLPPWEFFEGALTALLCTRRAIGADEWVPTLFGCDDADELFATPAEYTRFSMGWMERESQLRAQLEASIESSNGELALDPAVIDWRGMSTSLPEAERAKASQDDKPPALAQLWALGFMFAVDRWVDDWAPPRDKDIAADIDDALECIGTLLEDDTRQPTLNLYDENGPSSVSQARVDAFGEAMYAVSDLYSIARSLGPRIEPVRRQAKIGRNDPCPCGSGKKYKKCCGA